MYLKQQEPTTEQVSYYKVCWHPCSLINWSIIKSFRCNRDAAVNKFTTNIANDCQKYTVHMVMCCEKEVSISWPAIETKPEPSRVSHDVCFTTDTCKCAHVLRRYVTSYQVPQVKRVDHTISINHPRLLCSSLSLPWCWQLLYWHDAVIWQSTKTHWGYQQWQGPAVVGNKALQWWANS